MIIYVLTSGVYSSYRIVGLYSTEEKAEIQKELTIWAEEDSTDISIEEWELDVSVWGANPRPPPTSNE